MELWIRSQDKLFIKKVNQVGIVEGKDYWEISENLLTVFGIYKTKERALEVLHDIQQVLLNNEDCDYIGTALVDYQSNNFVYEMPEN